jgi:hypothetical protein
MSEVWDYRVVRKESEDGSDEWYSIQEVYYDEGKPMAQTIDLQIEGDTITGMRTQLENMLEALDEPVLDESDITDTKNDWICEICGKDTSNVDYDYIGSGTNHLKCELIKEKVEDVKERYIYESPDGGKTIYRRKFGEPITWPREKVTKEKWQNDVDEKRGL